MKYARPLDWQIAIRPHNPQSIKQGIGLDFIWSGDVELQRQYFAEWVTQEWLEPAKIAPLLLWDGEDELAPHVDLRLETKTLSMPENAGDNTEIRRVLQQFAHNK